MNFVSQVVALTETSHKTSQHLKTETLILRFGDATEQRLRCQEAKEAELQQKKDLEALSLEVCSCLS